LGNTRKKGRKDLIRDWATLSVAGRRPRRFPRIAAEDSSVHQTHRWLILTTTRLNEALGARWGEIDLDAATWSIPPPSRMKMGEAFSVPLSSQRALDILRAQEALRGRKTCGLRPAHSRRHLYVTGYSEGYEGFSHFVTSMTAPVASG
jgi:integrase